MTEIINNVESNIESKGVTLISSDNVNFDISFKASQMSILIEEMTKEKEEEEEDGEKDSKQIIPLLNIKSDILKLIVDFCEYHAITPVGEIEKPLKKVEIKEILSEWDLKFLKMENEVLLELILAANYMDIKELLSVVCVKIAFVFRNNTVEEIKNIFKITK